MARMGTGECRLRTRTHGRSRSLWRRRGGSLRCSSSGGISRWRESDGENNEGGRGIPPISLFVSPPPRKQKKRTPKMKTQQKQKTRRELRRRTPSEGARINCIIYYHLLFTCLTFSILSVTLSVLYNFFFLLLFPSQSHPILSRRFLPCLLSLVPSFIDRSRDLYALFLPPPSWSSLSSCLPTHSSLSTPIIKVTLITYLLVLISRFAICTGWLAGLYYYYYITT